MTDIQQQVLSCVLKLASQKKEITYKEVCEELKLESEEILEDNLSTLIIDGALNVKLDQVNKRIISRMNPQSVITSDEPITLEQWQYISSTLSQWKKSLDSVLQNQTVPTSSS